MQVVELTEFEALAIASCGGKPLTKVRTVLSLITVVAFCLGPCTGEVQVRRLYPAGNVMSQIT